eukprot:GFYU01008186.1.p1 GENE.GFYU01008186.1~~GFYU01008186.1.p1  ORF type:complete len:230 (-),score=60.06 GFYU01008186.1:29-718(-)
MGCGASANAVPAGGWAEHDSTKANGKIEWFKVTHHKMDGPFNKFLYGKMADESDYETYVRGSDGPGPPKEPLAVQVMDKDMEVECNYEDRGVWYGGQLVRYDGRGSKPCYDVYFKNKGNAKKQEYSFTPEQVRPRTEACVDTAPDTAGDDAAAAEKAAKELAALRAYENKMGGMHKFRCPFRGCDYDSGRDELCPKCGRNKRLRYDTGGGLMPGQVRADGSVIPVDEQV